MQTIKFPFSSKDGRPTGKIMKIAANQQISLHIVKNEIIDT